MSPNKNPSTEEKKTEPEESFISQKSDENSNGLPVNEILYFPEEVLAEMLKHCNNKTLLSCHLVCKQWDVLIKDYVWRKKAEYVTRQEWPLDPTVPWTYYYYLCDNKPFGKNLAYNKVLPFEDPTVKVFRFQKGEDIPVDIKPFPEDDTFQGTCIVTNVRPYFNHFVIDLLEEGFTEHILDKLRPIVKVTNWYASCPNFTNPNYICDHKLVKSDFSVLSEFFFSTNVIESGKWIKFTKSFEDYGEGLRKIKCHHRGCRGVVMVGHSVTLEIPIRT